MLNHMGVFVGVEEHLLLAHSLQLEASLLQNYYQFSFVLLILRQQIHLIGVYLRFKDCWLLVLAHIK